MVVEVLGIEDHAVVEWPNLLPGGFLDQERAEIWCFCGRRGSRLKCNFFDGANANTSDER